MIGALISGAVAVLLALVALGPVQALIMLGIVLLVQQLESHILQPLIMGKAVSLHPLAVIFSVAGGSMIFEYLFPHELERRKKAEEAEKVKEAKDSEGSEESQESEKA